MNISFYKKYLLSIPICRYSCFYMSYHFSIGVPCSYRGKYICLWRILLFICDIRSLLIPLMFSLLCRFGLGLFNCPVLATYVVCSHFKVPSKYFGTWYFSNNICRINIGCGTSESCSWQTHWLMFVMIKNETQSKLQ